MAQQLGSFEKVLRVGEGRRLKRLGEQAAYIGTLEPDFEELSDSDLAATQALYLNALAGRGVHLVTVNDYLAKRDREWTLPVFEALGMRTGYLENMMPFAPRKEAYEADVTYGTNSEFGFDYLRDNMSV